MTIMNSWLVVYLVGVAIKTILVVPCEGNRRDPDKGFLSVVAWPFYLVLEILLIIGKLSGLIPK